MTPNCISICSAVRLTAVSALAIAVGAPALADLVASEDFDGGAVNVISGYDAASFLDGGGGDFFGVGSIAAWPQGSAGQAANGGLDGPGAPFGVADDTLTDVSGGTFDFLNSFPTDSEGVYGQEVNVDNTFFAISDTLGLEGDGFASGDFTASWTFDVSGFTDLRLSIDMGQQSDADSFGGIDPDSFINFDVSFDGGAAANAISVMGDATANADPDFFEFRPMDSGFITADDTGDGPAAAIAGPAASSAVIKTEVDTGVAPANGNTVLNKAPSSGTGAGELDTFAVDLAGSGGTLTLTVTADLAFEAFVFDNIVIEGTPSTGGLEADFNQDGIVNLLDLDILGANWQMNGTASTGDANGDGFVNLLDLDTLGAQWQMSGSFAEALAASGIAVPEPGSFALIIAGSALIARRRRAA